MATRTWISPALENATGVLTFTGNPADGNTVVIGHLIGNKDYIFQTVLTNIDGNVLIGADQDASLVNLTNAINDSGGTKGTDYATATIPHLYVTAVADTSNDTMTVTAKVGGSTFNAFPTTETIPGTWAAATLENGVGGDWGTSGNWSGGAVPVSGDDVEFGLNSVASVTGGFSQSAVDLDSMFVSGDYKGLPGQFNVGNVGRKRTYTTFTATSSTATTVVDSTNGWQAGRFVFFLITQTSGLGKGQFRSIAAGNTDTTITITSAWDTNPVAGDTFIIEEFARLSIDCTKLVYGGRCEEFRVLAATGSAGAIDELIVHATSSSTTQATVVGGFIDSVVLTDGTLELNNLGTMPSVRIIRSSGNPKCIIKPDVSLILVENFGGKFETQSSMTTFRQSTGTSTINDFIPGVSSPTVGTLDLVDNGTCEYLTTGTLTKAILAGKLDLSDNLGPVVITDTDLHENGQLDISNGLSNITLVNDIAFLGATGVAKITITPGTDISIS